MIANPPLHGIRMVVLGQFLPAPYCAQLLQAFGAHVMKVEPPGGDPLQASQAGMYRLMNSGFEIIRANLRNPAELSRVADAIDSADVVVESFRPGKLARYGLDAPSVRRRNPGVVYCSISGFGQTGRKRNKVGHDLTYLAWAGLLSLPVDIEGHVARPSVPLADASASIYGALSIVTALLGRALTGEGCYIDVALAETSLALGILRAGWLGGDSEQARKFPHLAASNEVYATKCGRHVAVSLHEDHFWDAFVRRLSPSFPDLADERFARLPGRQAEPEALGRLLRSVFLGASESALQSLVDDDDLPVEWVQDVDGALQSDHALERQIMGVPSDGSAYLTFPALFDGARPAIRGVVGRE